METRNIKDFIHLYLGCEFLWFVEDRHHKYVLDAAFLREILAKHSPFENIKPLLRPLSSMTEEEAFEIALMFGVSHGDDITKINATKSLFESNGYWNKRTNLSGSQWNNIINYCRRQCIDMDSLIDAGLAIEIQKLTSHE